MDFEGRGVFVGEPVEAATLIGDVVLHAAVVDVGLAEDHLHRAAVIDRAVTDEVIAADPGRAVEGEQGTAVREGEIIHERAVRDR